MPDGAPRRSWYRIVNAAGGAEILLYDEVGLFGVTARDFLADLKAVGAKPIALRVNSPGGDVFDGLAIFNGLRRHPAKITAHIDGVAASIASVICMAAHEIRAAGNAVLMIHDPTGVAIGRAEDMDKMAGTLRMVKGSIVAAYRRSGKPDAEIEAMMSEETWLSAEDARRHGFVDHVDEPIEIAARFDLSKFANVPPGIRAALERGSAARGGRSMPEMLNPPAETPAPPAPAPDATALIRSAYKSAATLGLENTAVDELLDAGVDPRDVPQGLIDLAGARDLRASAVQRIFPAGGATQTRHDEAAIIEALAARLSGTSATGNPWASRSLLEIARARIEAAGYSSSGLTREQILFPRISAAASHTSSDFPLLLSGAVNKSLLALYQQVESPLKQIARQNNRGDFKTGSIINLGQFPALDEILEDAEIKHGSIDESAENWRLKSYGKIFSITFQSLVNDDLSGFGDWARAAAISAAQAEGDLLFALLSANTYAGATLSDGAALFHSSHSNLAGSGGAFSVTTLGAAVAAMRQQKALGATVPLGIAPKYVLTGPAPELVVRQVLSTTVVPNASNVANPWRDVVEVLIEPRLAARTDWYCFASPGLWPVLEWGYLNSAIGPQITTKESFERLAISTRLVLHFGAGVVDHRGAYRNPGA